ncbi:hypothetical protein BDV10DRAFT_168537 [Aspergillus recurvatus]
MSRSALRRLPFSLKGKLHHLSRLLWRSCNIRMWIYRLYIFPSLCSVSYLWPCLLIHLHDQISVDDIDYDSS